MWDVFALAVAAEVALAFAPAGIALIALRVDRAVSVAMAPAVAVVAATAVAFSCKAANLPCSWSVIALSLAVAAVAVCLASTILRRARAARGGAMTFRARANIDRGRLARFLVAVCLGVAAGALLFCGNIDGADSFSQEYDDVHHLAEIQAFLETGAWTPFDGAMYPGVDAAFAPRPDGGFYPSAWHLLAAFSASLTGAPVPVAANATTFLFGFVVYPVAMWAFLEKAFAGRPAAVVLGSCAAISFGAFPYGLITFGPLYPNLASFAMVPAAGACFLALTGEGVPRLRRVGLGALFAIGLAALVLAQPNGAFSLGVLMMFYCAMLCARAGGACLARRCGSEATDRKLFAAKAACALGFMVLAGVLWVALWAAPFMRNVVTHQWGAFSSVSQALVNVVIGGFGQFAPCVVLALLIAVGGVYTLFRRQYLWLTCSYAFACLMYFTCAVGGGFWKSLAAGFWYTDAYRVAATVVIIGVPLAALGLYACWRGARAGIAAAARHTATGASYARFALPAVAMVFLGTALAPTFDFGWNGPVVTTMGSVSSVLESQFRLDEQKVYDGSEREFVAQVAGVVPSDAIILNEPNDGSAFAYCADGLNVVYRLLRDFEGPDETVESRIVRLGLSDIARDPSVAQAVHAMGAEYLLQLDQPAFYKAGGPGEGASVPRLFSYEPAQWTGIDAVGDDTPGFEVVLSKGDMRLYRIVV